MRDTIGRIIDFNLLALRILFVGSVQYYMWMSFLTLLIMGGLLAYAQQYDTGMAVTGMNDIVSWGLYIANFTYFVGVAASALMIVMPFYIFKEQEFRSSVLVGEAVAVAAITMCILFVTVDIGGPLRVWHLMPFVGTPNFPDSILTWDILVLNGYLMLNLGIPIYLLYKKAHGRDPVKKHYYPFVITSIFWAVSIHMVTAFLFQGIQGKPFWASALMAPKFLASAFSSGLAFILILLTIVRTLTRYEISNSALHKMAQIMTVASLVNMIMFFSEYFKEFYMFAHHSESAQYLYWGLGDHMTTLNYLAWGLKILSIVATIALTVGLFKGKFKLLIPLCGAMFISAWFDKGIAFVVPGFVPSPLGEEISYVPTLIEWGVLVGVCGIGLITLTILLRLIINIELGGVKIKEAK
ncbi:MAG: polysulfide reductase NrfD [Fibrobacterales bacterium]